MRNLSKILMTLLLCSMAQIMNAQTFDWVKNPGSNAVDPSYRITIDNSGNNYTTGMIWNSGGNHSLCSGTIGNVLIKNNSAGTCVWQISIPGKGTCVTYYNNNIYVCGIMGTPAGIGDMFVAKYDLNGNQVGTIYYATSTGSYPSSIEAYGISVNANGVFVCGSIFREAIFYSQPDYNGAANTVSLGATRFGIFVLKLDASLNLVWQNVPAGTGDAEAFAISNASALTAQGCSFITGYYNNTAFSGGVLLTSVGGSDAFVAKLDAAGTTWNWTKTGGSTNAVSFDRGTDILISPVHAGLLFVSGTFTGSGTIQGTNVTGGWLAKYTTTGGAQSGVVGTGGADAMAVSVEGTTGNVFCGGEDFLNKYTNTLSLIWGTPIVNSLTYIYGLASNSCSTYFTGSLYFPGGTCSLTIGPSTLSNFAASCASDRDVIIGRLSNGFSLTTTGVNCSSTSFPLNATTGFTTYTWTPNIGSTASVTATPCSNNIINYSVTASNASCSYSASITVRPKMTVSINAGNCMNNPQTFTASSSCAIPVTTYQWFKNGSSIFGATNSSYFATTGGSYKVVATNGAGCSATSNTSVIDCTCCRVSDETGEADKYTVLPNPNKGNFSVSGLSAGDLVSVITITGQEVYHHLITNDLTSYKIDLVQMSQGIYLLKIQNAEGLVVKKFSIHN